MARSAESSSRCSRSASRVPVACYAALPPSADGSVVAEVAIAVAPEWRRVGLATLLIELLARRALECGIAAFTCAVPREQPSQWPNLARGGHARVVIAEGAAQLYATLATRTRGHVEGSADRRPAQRDAPSPAGVNRVTVRRTSSRAATRISPRRPCA
ncbi:MAG: GNAT family N-acetyltransferase [Mycobacterium sp.]|uniref:GNAT family N-acetyltransferase n=1 Tax=Mycobacterium sp. TaxID=1785 RepID=UPI003F99A4F4